MVSLVKKQWTEDDIKKLVILRAANVSYEVISKQLHKSVNACHTKFYALASTKKPKGYMEIYAGLFNFMEGNQIGSKERDAVGRAILRSKHFNVNGRENICMVPYDGGEVAHKIHTVIGANMVVNGGMFETGPCVIVWLQPNHHIIILTTYSTAYEEDAA